MIRVAVAGGGAVGARIVRQLTSTPSVTSIVLAEPDVERAEHVVASMADPDRVRAVPVEADWAEGADVAVLALPAGTHRVAAERLLEAGTPLVSASDAVDDVTGLLALDAEARERGVAVVIGAAFAPGLTDVLATHAAAALDGVDEIHVARVGTGGPACAHQHHAALRGEALDWREGAWVSRRAGSGRELCWFPDPIGAEDCYRAALPDPLLLVPAFPGIGRCTSRLGANRRDRLTARLPMLRPPHPEGGVGAVRVEVRGRRGGGRDVEVLGAMDRPAVAAGAVAATTALVVADGRMAPGAAGLAGRVEPVPFLVELAARGIKAARFVGSAAAGERVGT